MERGKPAGPELARRLGPADAVVLGLGSMLGAGVFACFAPAAAVADAGLLIALAIAAVVAYCDAVASAQLAARYPESWPLWAAATPIRPPSPDGPEAG